MATKICPCCSMENDASEQSCQVCNYEFAQQVAAPKPSPVPRLESHPPVFKRPESAPSMLKQSDEIPKHPVDETKRTVDKASAAPSDPVQPSYPPGDTVRTRQAVDVFFDADQVDDDAPPTKGKQLLVPIISGGILLAAIVGGIIFAISQQPKTDGNAGSESSTGLENSTAIEETSAPEVISSGFVDCKGKDYVTLYQAMDTSSSAVARGYTGDAVDIYAMEGEWYHVQLGEVTGYLEAEHVVFSKPIAQTETAAPSTTETAKVQQETQAQTKALPKPTADADIEIKTVGDSDIFTLKVSGSYAYYTYEGTAYYLGGEYESISKKTSSESSVTLVSSSMCEAVTVEVIPYNVDGTPGEAVTARADLTYAPPQQSASVSSCNYSGQINTHGGVVAGFTTSYVVNNGASSHVRDSLGNAWHVTAVNYCYAHGVNWYELYDSDDGDYYGWVDENYIDFY